MTREELAREIAKVATLEGTFTLRSGQVAHRYFDKYRFEGAPTLLRPLAVQMARLLPSDTEIVAGLELGGVPLATALSLETGLPAAFIRKEAKTYGTCRAIEGQDVAGKNVTFIEDVITTGGAVADALALATAEGAIVTTVICAIWRGEGSPRIAKAPDLEVRPVFTKDDLTQNA
ncbi:MAG: orotate phosphoribosyltransferase [Rhodobacterales bacterium]|nr:MAG: orotate phosphoribosyltransferase [Rhodobacterales bacterium]